MPRKQHWIVQAVIYSTYAGNLPKNAMNAEFISWVEENYSRLKHVPSFYVKIGGNKGSPEDWKINILEVAKGIKIIPEDSVKVSIAEL